MTRRTRSRPRPRREPRGRVRAKRTPRRTRQGWGAKLGRLLLGLALAAILSIAALFSWGLIPQRPTIPGERPVAFVVRENDRRALVEQLEDAGLVASPRLMRLYWALFLPRTEFEERAHFLQGGMAPRDLTQMLVGQSVRPAIRITFPEGYTHFKMAERLEQKLICSRHAFEVAVKHPRLLRELGIPRGSAEGYLFPATYQFYADSDPEDVVRRLVLEMRKRLAELGGIDNGTPELEELSFGEAELLTLASIVEKETSSKSERPRIARVFLNRLLFPKAGTAARLQSDPTAGYGCLLEPAAIASCADYTGMITPALLRDERNPYNTYRHKGLPPGPIANPGSLAIEAVLFPAPGNDFFFVADGRGGHTFSKNYSDHRRAVEKLRRKSR